MAELRSILVDDEQSARDVLRNLLEKFCPQVTILDTCENLTQAAASIQRHNPDLVFLDIEMPQYAGYEIGSFFEIIPFEIIFITAYDSYALRAFELSAVDYLLKPVDIGRLKSAVERAALRVDMRQKAERLALLSQTLKTGEMKNILIPEKGEQHLIALESIIAIEAQESYSTFHTADRKYVASKNLSHFENLFTGNPDFIRVHKSWMISKNHLVHYSRTDLTITLTGGLVAKLSKYKKADFEQALLGK